MFETWELMALDYEERKATFQAFIRQNPHLTFYDYINAASDFGFENEKEIILMIEEVDSQ